LQLRVDENRSACGDAQTYIYKYYARSSTVWINFKSTKIFDEKYLCWYLKKNYSLDVIIEGNMVEPIVGNVHEGVGGAEKKYKN
jgi:hypothetical protein